MLRKCIRIRQGYTWLWPLFLLGSILVAGCKTIEPSPTIYIPASQAASKASLVSVRATGVSTAEVIVKSTAGLADQGWQVAAETTSGGPITLTPGSKQSLVTFTLTTCQAAGLVSGQTYRFTLQFVYNGRDTLSAERTYVHTLPAYWRRLSHLDTDEGDFTGSLLISKQSGTDYISAVRYVTDEQWQALLYDRSRDQWLTSSVPDLVPAYVPRHGLIRFQLQTSTDVSYVFNGLGFLYNALDQNHRLYKNTLFVKDNQGVKEIKDAGGDGEIAFFTTSDRAFLLTQLGPPALCIRRGNWEQYRGPDFPEAPGTLATFLVNGIGNVVNQIEGRPPHLYAYNPTTDQWSRRADFPGASRSRGVGFSAGNQGYFGLGATGEEERGLRDLWQYDPTTDRWQYVTDYPGQGHQYVMTNSAGDRAYLGWGYENQPTPSGGARQVGCTDFWEFKP
ncbi:Kelch repeat-containing protein [Spirosoma pollinicola]|uniref:Uncharacterized protein n=1 Tax=Spirosoma pollinicola TaxID=2057025 RepID=A0A2K8Z2U5_9BACT|nr:hypothetical protein [Spirosoma pollinicola]AUD04171.1 hypothetical protein CWM47_21430 [Spirosoma pollinicola]